MIARPCASPTASCLQIHVWHQGVDRTRTPIADPPDEPEAISCDQHLGRASHLNLGHVEIVRDAREASGVWEVRSHH
jgi:hypothetical protein